MIVELVANCWILFLCHTFYFYSDLDDILVHGQNDKFRLSGPFIDVKAFSNVLKQRVFLFFAFTNLSSLRYATEFAKRLELN